MLRVHCDGGVANAVRPKPFSADREICNEASVVETDISDIPMVKAFVYLLAIVDWLSQDKDF